MATDNDEWCDFSDMPKVGCEHCNPTRPQPKPLLGPIFVAQYQGTCCVCGKDIELGDHIGALLEDEGEYAHYGCGR